MQRRLYWDCVFLAPCDSQDAAAAVVRDVVAPAWTAAGGVREPVVLWRSQFDSDDIRLIAEAPVVFVDVSGDCEIALYWLGARDVAARQLTVPVARGPLSNELQTMLGARLVNLDDPAQAQRAIGHRFDSLRQKDDAYLSPLAAALPGMHTIWRTPKSSTVRQEEHLWTVAALDDGGRPTAEMLPTRIGVLCGDLRAVSGIDVWVNSENTLMEMGRMADHGISALIRYMGAQGTGQTGYADDIIQRELMGAVGGRSRPVSDGSVFWTGPGRLAERGVRMIAHVAAVKPKQPLGSGFVPVDDLPGCVVNVLDTVPRATVRDWRRLLSGKQPEIKSILFPLMGTGNVQHDARIVSCSLISTAVEYLRRRRPRGLERVLFLAHSDVDLELCQNALSSIEGLTKQL